LPGMAPDATLRHMTAQELLEYRHEPYRHELVDGILREMEPPGYEHGRIAMRIGALLYAHVHEHGLGATVAAETGFLLASDPDTVRAPDAAFVSRERAEAVGPTDRYWPGAPDLAIEVVSPTDRHSEVEAKALDWLAAGAGAVVVLDPPLRTATIYRSRSDIRIVAGDEALDLHDVVAGFAPRTADLFI
jgi:Uma2 family endonuclease